METRTRLELAEKMVRVGVIKDAMTYSDWIFINLTEKQERQLLVKLYEAEQFPNLED
jgi:hypothetical protein